MVVPNKLVGALDAIISSIVANPQCAELHFQQSMPLAEFSTVRKSVAK